MTCSEIDCGARVLARGLCSEHYKRWQRAGKPDGRELTARTKGSCVALGCEGLAYARGHCSRHYRRLAQPKGQRVDDKVAFARHILELYGERGTTEPPSS